MPSKTATPTFEELLPTTQTPPPQGVSVLAPLPTTPVGLKRVSEVLTALQKRYDGPIDEVDGFSYIPWHISVDLANEVFGYFGWSSEVLTCDYVECDVEVYNRETKTYDTRNFKGFKSIVRIGVQVVDDATGQTITTHHDGVGFGEIRGMGGKNPMDNASKSAKSDGISTAIKHYGNAFGLFLYEKENKQATTTGATSSNGSRPTTTTGGGKPSEKQVDWLLKKGLSQEIVEQLSGAQAKEALDLLFGGTKATEVATHLGFTLAPKGDNLPLPRRS